MNLFQFDNRVETCRSCKSPVQLMSATNMSDPEFPEMMLMVSKSDPWVGIIEDDQGKMQLVVCCSTTCLHRLSRDGLR